MISDNNKRIQKVTIANRAAFIILYSNNITGEGIIAGSFYTGSGATAKLLMSRGSGVPELYYDGTSTIALNMTENWGTFTIICNMTSMPTEATVDSDLTGFTQVTIQS